MTADNSLPVVQALLRWDAPWLAARELRERAAAGLPPATRMASLIGESADIDEVVAALTVPHRTLGPVPFGEDGRLRALVVVERERGAELAAQLRGITERAIGPGEGPTGARPARSPLHLTPSYLRECALVVGLGPLKATTVAHSRRLAGRTLDSRHGHPDHPTVR